MRWICHLRSDSSHLLVGQVSKGCIARSEELPQPRNPAETLRVPLQSSRAPQHELVDRWMLVELGDFWTAHGYESAEKSTLQLGSQDSFRAEVDSRMFTPLCQAAGRRCCCSQSLASGGLVPPSFYTFWAFASTRPTDGRFLEIAA